MKFSTVLTGESLRSTALDIRTARLAKRTLVHILAESDDGSRTFYSFISVLLPCADLRDDICIVHDVTGDKAEADRLFCLLVQGTVTPCTMQDVLSDLL